MKNFVNTIYYDLVVPVPDNATVLKTGRIQIYDYFGGKQHRYSLGISSGEGEMHPNQRYVDLYTNDFLKRYPEKKGLIHPHQLSVGLFALVLGISQSLGMYRILFMAYGSKLANAILDYAMYNISTHSNVDELFASKMDRQMLFCVKPYKDSWYSNMFCHEMSDEQNALFCSEWLDLCLKMLCNQDVLISIDGSNIDCSSQNSKVVKHGKEKSNSGSMIVSFIWVICSSGDHKGVPLTYFVYEGNKVDCKALKKVMARLKNHKINVAGAILDRGFCTKECFTELETQHIPYEIMMTSNTEGYTTMMDDYAATIFNHAHYRLEGKPGKYGITANDVKLMATSATTACTCLLYDDNNGSKLRTAYIKEVEKERNRVYKAAIEHPYDCEISGKYAGVLKFTGRADIVAIDDDALEIELHKKGYSAITSSKVRTAQEIDDVYNLRDVAEKVFMEVKSQLGYDAIRGSGTESIFNRFFVCFVACILRAEMVNVCRKYDLDTNLMISDLDFLQYEFNGSNYEYSTSPTKVQVKVLSEFGITNEKVALLSETVNERLTLDVDSVHRPPAHTWTMPEKKKAGRKPSNKLVPSLSKKASDSVDEKMGGKLTREVPSIVDTVDHAVTGPVDKYTTFTSEQIFPKVQVPCEPQDTTPVLKQESDAVPEGRQSPPVEPPKRKPGRPPGSKNKKTLEREKAKAEREARGETPIMLPAASRGRPKTQATLQKEEKEREWILKAEMAGVPLPDLPKRGRGQPSKEAVAKREAIISDWMARVEVEYSKALAIQTTVVGAIT